MPADSFRDLLRHNEYREAKSAIRKWLLNVWDRLGTGDDHPSLHSSIRLFVKSWLAVQGLAGDVLVGTSEVILSWVWPRHLAPGIQTMLALHAGTLTLLPDSTILPGPRFPTPIDLDERWKVQEEKGKIPYDIETGKCYLIEDSGRMWVPEEHFVGIWRGMPARKDLYTKWIWMDIDALLGRSEKPLYGYYREDGMRSSMSSRFSEEAQARHCGSTPRHLTASQSTSSEELSDLSLRQ